MRISYVKHIESNGIQQKHNITLLHRHQQRVSPEHRQLTTSLIFHFTNTYTQHKTPIIFVNNNESIVIHMLNYKTTIHLHTWPW